MGNTKLPVVGEQLFALEGDVYQLVTFLNKTLKDRDLIFGLTLEAGVYRITVYDSADSVHTGPVSEEK